MTESLLAELADLIKLWGRELGFQQVGITDCQLEEDGERLRAWIDKGYHADMEWMGAHGEKRWRPALLEEGTVRAISVRLDYLPPDTQPIKVLKDSSKAYVSRYANGRDYHKLIRKRLASLAKKIDAFCAEQGIDSKGRAFTDSAPVMERALARKAGLGWVGKNCLLINSKAGSFSSSARSIPTCPCLSIRAILPTSAAIAWPALKSAQPMPLSARAP